MNLFDFLAKMFNGNETARSMRYSITIIVAAIVASYMGLINHEALLSIFYVMIGYITGKARSETHVIEPKDRRGDTNPSTSIHIDGSSSNTISP
jgi:hypothetical protein